MAHLQADKWICSNVKTRMLRGNERKLPKENELAIRKCCFLWNVIQILLQCSLFTATTLGKAQTDCSREVVAMEKCNMIYNARKGLLYNLGTTQALADLGLRCLLTESVDTVAYERLPFLEVPQYFQMMRKARKGSLYWLLTKQALITLRICAG